MQIFPHRTYWCCAELTTYIDILSTSQKASTVHNNNNNYLVCAYIFPISHAQVCINTDFVFAHFSLRLLPSGVTARAWRYQQQATLAQLWLSALLKGIDIFFT